MIKDKPYKNNDRSYYSIIDPFLIYINTNKFIKTNILKRIIINMLTTIFVQMAKQSFWGLHGFLLLYLSSSGIHLCATST